MRLLPLGLTANAASWRLDPESLSGGQAHLVMSRDGGACRFCGLQCGPWAEVFHQNGDHADNAVANLATACPSCHACQHLGRDGIELEHVLIWMPQITQAALNHLTRSIHFVFMEHGQLIDMSAPPTRDTDALRSAYVAYQELKARSSIVQANLGFCSPLLLGETLLSLPPPAAAQAPLLVDGLRLLSLGKLHRKGRDVYPDYLEDCAAFFNLP